MSDTPRFTNARVDLATGEIHYTASVSADRAASTPLEAAPSSDCHTCDECERMFDSLTEKEFLAYECRNPRCVNYAAPREVSGEAGEPTVSELVRALEEVARFTPDNRLWFAALKLTLLDAEVRRLTDERDAMRHVSREAIRLCANPSRRNGIMILQACLDALPRDLFDDLRGEARV